MRCAIRNVEPAALARRVMGGARGADAVIKLLSPFIRVVLLFRYRRFFLVTPFILLFGICHVTGNITQTQKPSIARSHGRLAAPCSLRRNVARGSYTWHDAKEESRAVKEACKAETESLNIYRYRAGSPGMKHLEDLLKW